MALRLNWGNNKGFLMSVGGFHPSFKPPAELNVPNLKRLSLTIFADNPLLRLTTYFAITSNTVQFGAKLELKFEVGPFSVEGYLGFDVLFQFSPFKFIAKIEAGIAVKMGGSTLFSIELEFNLSGPTPWNANGTASFKILFFTIKVRFNVTWGEEQHVIEPPIPVIPKLIEAFSSNEQVQPGFYEGPYSGRWRSDPAIVWYAEDQSNRSSIKHRNKQVWQPYFNRSEKCQDHFFSYRY
jgi:hypothetical protein